MSVYNLYFRFGLRLLVRERRRFVLPFLSLLVTGVVLFLMLLLSAAGSQFLSDEARALEGGDVVFESASPLDSADLVSQTGLNPDAIATQLDFTATLESDAGTGPFSIVAVDEQFPLYGELTLEGRDFEAVRPGSVYIDRAGADRLGVQPGDTVQFGVATLTVAGIIESEPTSLFGGFRFFPRALMHTKDFTASGIDPALLRIEYKVTLKVPTLTAADTVAIRAVSESQPAIDVDIAGEDQQGLTFGLATVTDFLTVAILITAVLAAVNVYASTLYLITVERKSLAVLLALGLTRRGLLLVLFVAVASTVLLSGALSVAAGGGLFSLLTSYIDTAYAISLPTPSFTVYGSLTVATIFLIAIASFIPATGRMLALNPRQALLGETELGVGRRAQVKNFLFLTASALTPLIVLSATLLESFISGVLVITGIVCLYVIVAALYAALVSLAYRFRDSVSFPLRSILSQKRADGLFGIVSFTSLFVALAALGTLMLTQLSIERFLAEDLASTVPSVYLIDVQPSQRDALLEAYPDLTLFPNWGARIVGIDGVDIQAEIAAGNPDYDRELRREFNLTARADLLASETVTAGVWGAGQRGEVSVDEEFAARAGILLGSVIDFTIQGFPVSGTVTSFRNTDSRSGLPFFYFVLSPEDIADFPAVYFGYAYYSAADRQALGRFVAEAMPNVSVLDTATLGELVIRIVSTLVLLVFIVTLPPLIIALLLVVTLIISSYAERRRHSARLRAIGLTKHSAFVAYVAETVSITVLAAALAYGVSLVAATIITRFYLELDVTVLIATELFLGLASICLCVSLLAYYLFKTDILPLRELLSYE